MVQTRNRVALKALSLVWDFKPSLLVIIEALTVVVRLYGDWFVLWNIAYRAARFCSSFTALCCPVFKAKPCGNLPWALVCSRKVMEIQSQKDFFFFFNHLIHWLISGSFCGNSYVHTSSAHSQTNLVTQVILTWGPGYCNPFVHTSASLQREQWS